MRNKYLYILILSLLFCACDKSASELEPTQGPNEWITAKVVVVLPLTGEGTDKARYERISKLFEENVTKAQYDQSVGVKLELEWYDENTVNLSKLAHEIYYRDDIKAVIGPLNDDNIELVANVIDDAGIPMFVMSSCEDVVRRYSCGTAGVSVKKPFMWTLSETDVVQAYLSSHFTTAISPLETTLTISPSKIFFLFLSFNPVYCPIVSKSTSMPLTPSVFLISAGNSGNSG